MYVLTDVGERILHGIISCLVRAHKAFRSYNGGLTVENLWVTGYQSSGAIIPETASVDIKHGALLSYPLNVENQLEDYTKLSLIICEIVPETTPPSLQGHRLPDAISVERLDTIVWLLDKENLLSPERQHSRLESDKLIKRRNQLLQALAAMTDPLVMATMWWNLVRFQKSLEIIMPPPMMRQAFRDALHRTNHMCWCQYAERDPYFTRVFEFENKQEEYRKQDDGQGLLRFARNWFTHAPGHVLVRTLDYSGFLLPFLLPYINCTH